MHYLLASIAPVFIILIYIYYRDKWEKEPLHKLFLAIFLGSLIVIPIFYLENFLVAISQHWLLSNKVRAFYTGFIVAAFSEETFKFIAVLLMIWRSRHFNEKYDGIVYSVFVSLGFAMVENIIYVFNTGIEVALPRAITAVPAHALFGVVMGYHLAFARFSLFYKTRNFTYALLIPMILHGFYDFILMSGEQGYFIVFIVYIIFLYQFGLKKIKELSSIRRSS